VKFHGKTSTHVKEFAMKKFIKLDCGFEPMGTTKWDSIVNEVLRALEEVEESRHGFLGERQLCLLGCIIDVSKRVNGATRFTDVMDCVKARCGLKNAEHFYRYEEDLEKSLLVTPIKVSRGKNLYAPSIKGVFIYNVVAVLRLTEIDPQAFIQHAIVMLSLLRLLLKARENIFDKLLNVDENLGYFFKEAVDMTLSDLVREEDINQNITFLTKRVVTADGEEVRGFDMVEYLASVVVNLYLACAKGLIEYLNPNNLLKMGRVLEDFRNNELGGSQG